MFNPCNPKYTLFTFAIALFVGGITNPSSAAEFKFPDQVDIYVKSLGGGAGANSEFGLGTTSENFVPVLSGLPNNPSTNSEVFLGSFNPDQPIPLAVVTNWNGQSFFATIGSTDMASQIVFSDLDNSLGFGGNTFELLDTNIFLAHLDDAASFTVDDDDDDVLVQMRVASKRTTPESSSVLVYITLGGLMLGSAIRKARK